MRKLIIDENQEKCAICFENSRGELEYTIFEAADGGFIEVSDEDTIERAVDQLILSEFDGLHIEKHKIKE